MTIKTILQNNQKHTLEYNKYLLGDFPVKQIIKMATD